jgi:hypothetical protein
LCFLNHLNYLNLRILILKKITLFCVISIIFYSITWVWLDTWLLASSSHDKQMILSPFWLDSNFATFTLLCHSIQLFPRYWNIYTKHATCNLEFIESLVILLINSSQSLVQWILHTPNGRSRFHVKSNM